MSNEDAVSEKEHSFTVKARIALPDARRGQQSVGCSPCIALSGVMPFKFSVPLPETAFSWKRTSTHFTPSSSGLCAVLFPPPKTLSKL